jgi:xanthine dehydrogenase YagR molybdenum-binding subunit
MRDGEWLVGWGCAMATYPSQVAPAAVRVRVTADAKVRAETAAHEIGTGAYTVIGQAAAARLGVPLENVTVELGAVCCRQRRWPAAPIPPRVSPTPSSRHAKQLSASSLRGAWALDRRSFKRR